MSHSLPTPDAAAMEHSQCLVDLISDTIAKNGPISFSIFMDLVLYAPGLGYYVAGLEKFGASGDFVTAPEISPLFSQCLAKHCQQVGGDILEFGAGSGVMAADILLYLQSQNALPTNYYIVELSPDLQEKQRYLISKKIPEEAHRVIWLTTLDNFTFKGTVLANEVLDAMPVHRFKVIDGAVKELCVDYDNNEFVWTEMDAGPELLSAVDDKSFANGYESEVNLQLSAWLASINDILTEGEVVLIDYGFEGHEFYHPDRSEGTLMCHFRHHAHSNPFTYIGLQDVTAHVDFTAVMHHAELNGLTVKQFATQANYLITQGIAGMLTTNLEHADYYQQSQQLKKLIFPTEMGELFKVLVLDKITLICT